VFAEALREAGATVHYHEQLLAQTLDLPAGRAFVLDRVCTPQQLGPALVDAVRALFECLPGATLAEYLIGGVLKHDLSSVHSSSLRWGMLRADDYVLPPHRTICSHAITPAGSTVGWRSTRWPNPPGSAKPCTPGPSTDTTRCSPTPPSPATATTMPRTCPPP